MRGWRNAGVAVWLALPAVALAQSAPIAVPPAPPLVAAPPAATQPPPVVLPDNALAPPPDLVQSPPPDLVQPPAGAGTDADTGTPPAAAAPPAQSWLPGTIAQLGVLNEVDGSVAQVRIPVGGQAAIGDLTVGVLACLQRPPDQVPDAAVFVSAQSAAAAPVLNQAASPPQDPNHADAAGSADAGTTGAGDSTQPGVTVYRGWMLRSAPGAAVVGDAGETFRIINCS